MKEKTLELEKTINLIKQNTYEKKNKKKTIPEAPILAIEKHVIKEEPIQRMERFVVRPKTTPTGNRRCRFCGLSNWTPLHKCPGTETNCNKCGKRGHNAKRCRQKYPNNRTVKRLTEEEPDDRNETSSESDESIHDIKEIKKIEEKNKHYTATVKINGKKERIYNRYRNTDNNNATGRRNSKINRNIKNYKQRSSRQKNKVIFRGIFPVYLECENNKQKMEILIIERTDITPLVGMGWRKKIRLTIGRTQLVKNNKSERENVFNTFPDLFVNKTPLSTGICSALFAFTN